MFGTELMCSTALLIDTEEICIKQQAEVQVTLKQIMPEQEVLVSMLKRMKAIEEGRAEDPAWKFPTFAGEFEWLLTAMGKEND